MENGSLGVTGAPQMLVMGLALVTLCCSTYPTSGLQELSFAVEKHASDGPLALSMEYAPFSSFGFDTRCFDGAIPGPTFRMKPGETLEIQLTNNLLKENNKVCMGNASFCETEVINIHAHGLHVPIIAKEESLSFSGDDVFAKVAPGSTKTFKFEVPDDHMPGTHWYHPHHHHATALQIGGGAAGVLIVDDPAGYLPPVFASMPDRTMLITGHFLPTLQGMAEASQSGLLERAVQVAKGAGLPKLFFLVNGVLRPQMSLQSHLWYRFRLVYSSVWQMLNLGVAASTGGGTCSLQLMAKDGVYLNSFPRAVSTIYLVPGSRADVAVSCTCARYPCSVSLGPVTGESARRLRGLRRRLGGKSSAAKAGLLTLQILESLGAATPALPTTVVERPCYLADLRSAAVPAGHKANLTLDGPDVATAGPQRVQWNNDETQRSMTVANVQAVGGVERWPVIATLEVGSIYEIRIFGAHMHPFHQHINPFQIVSTPAGGAYGDGYFQEGDWHDTVMIADLAASEGITVRFQTDRFTGKQAVHCHILDHGDAGMMAFVQIAGQEGATWDGAEAADAKCYRSAFHHGRVGLRGGGPGGLSSAAFQNFDANRVDAVVGWIAFGLSSASARDNLARFKRAYRSNVDGEVASALRTALASALDGASAIDVTVFTEEGPYGWADSIMVVNFSISLSHTMRSARPEVLATTVQSSATSITSSLNQALPPYLRVDNLKVRAFAAPKRGVVSSGQETLEVATASHPSLWVLLLLLATAAVVVIASRRFVYWHIRRNCGTESERSRH